MKQRPTKEEHAQYYGKYINLVPDGDIIEVLIHQQNTLKGFLKTIDEEKANFRYADDKWSIKEVVGHILDGERIFAYRALRISRNDSKPLLGFEQNEYIIHSNYANILIEKIVDEFFLVRESNILMFKGFTDDMWPRMGNASGNPVSVRAIAYILAGHTEHHINVLKEKYNC